MYCNRCETKSDESKGFCVNCGNPLQNQGAPNLNGSVNPRQGGKLLFSGDGNHYKIAILMELAVAMGVLAFWHFIVLPDDVSLIEAVLSGEVIIFSLIAFAFLAHTVYSLFRDYSKMQTKLYVYGSHIEGVGLVNNSNSQVAFNLTYQQISSVAKDKKAVSVITPGAIYKCYATNIDELHSTINARI